MNNSPEEEKSNADSMIGFGKRKAPAWKLVISVPRSCPYHYTSCKDLKEGNNSPIMETRAFYNLNMVNDHYYPLGLRG